MNIKNQFTRGRVTLPAEKGMEQQVALLADKWGADAVRDSDGTKLSPEIMEMGFEVYTTLCLIREDQEWLRQHPEYLQQMYLCSDAVIAETETVTIELLKNYFQEQFRIDVVHDPKIWWEVMDRTTGEVVPPALWDFQKETGRVVIHDSQPWHKYSVSFLVYQIWEPVSMYNHITNQWTEEHRMPLDPRHAEAREHLLNYLDQWLMEHSRTDVVRFTTFFYNFDLIYNQSGAEKQVNWFGYSSCVSPLALEQFAKEYGYNLRPEDFIDGGSYNTPFKVPSSKYLDWMEFNQKFIADLAKECVERVHRAGKKAIMFLGDHWAGTEPYGKYFKEIGLDAVVGAAGDGVTTRMISDIPVKATEVRFYPYFFPDIFHEGRDPVKELLEVWRKSRRALLRRATDRMGFGGYLSLVVKIPEFTEHIAAICEEFRTIHAMSKGTKPYSASFKVGILNAWGSIRSWMTHQVSHSLWNQRCYSYLGILEALAGLPFEVEFISFDDIKARGIPSDMGVIINAGDAGTAWSGGEFWKDEKVVTAIRKWVYHGGGFIGVGEPTACQFNGAYFQLPEILGVQKEIGLSVNLNKPKVQPVTEHFITDGLHGKIDYGEGMNSIYKCCETTIVLDMRNQSCSLAANTFGKGRAVYIAGLPFSTENTRLLSRVLYWSAGKEAEMSNWYCDNPALECAAYPDAGCFVVINNSYETQRSSITKPDGSRVEVELPALGYRWMEI